MAAPNGLSKIEIKLSERRSNIRS